MICEGRTEKIQVGKIIDWWEKIKYQMNDKKKNSSIINVSYRA